MWGEGGGGAYRIMIGKHEGKRSPGRTSRRRKDDITMGLKEIE
jgi:hypothetical protein